MCGVTLSGNHVNGDELSDDGRNPVNGDDTCENAPDPGNGDQAHECGPNSVNQPNALSISTGPYLNPDILEEIIRQTLSSYPHMRPTLRAVSRFFRTVVDREPLLRVYIPELNDFTNIYRVSVRKIMLFRGKSSGAVIRLREIINSALWASAWLSFIAAGNGWFFISKIYWKTKSQH